jgi:hypothetical protein
VRQPRASFNAWYVARNALGDHGLGFSLLRLTPQTDPKRMVGGHTDVCIDGFPRSGNTFAVLAFKRWNPDASVAHHMHAPEQVRQAAQLGVPCAVLVRSPLEAVSSLLAYYDFRVSPRAAINSYIRFHRGILPVRDRIAICRFERVVADPSSLVRQLNRSSRAAFRWEGANGRFEAELEGAIRRDYRARRRPSHTFGLPSARKEEMKASARALLTADRRLGDADSLYRALVDESPPAR